jgi:hypothetical protein
MYRGRAVLHCTKTNLYYVAPNQWTADPKQARDFEQVHDATRIDREQQMTDMEVVLRYHDPSCDLVLPLRKP